jgi:hypothetical protein
MKHLGMRPSNISFEKITFEFSINFGWLILIAFMLGCAVSYITILYLLKYGILRISG